MGGDDECSNDERKKGPPSDHRGTAEQQKQNIRMPRVPAAAEDCPRNAALRTWQMSPLLVVHLLYLCFHSDGLMCSRLALWEGPGCSCASIQALELLDSVERWMAAVLHGGAATLGNERLKHG